MYNIKKYIGSVMKIILMMECVIKNFEDSCNTESVDEKSE